MGTGIVSLVFCLFAGFPLCCLLFEPVAIKELHLQERESWFEFILIEVCLQQVPRRTFRSICSPKSHFCMFLLSKMSLVLPALFTVFYSSVNPLPTHLSSVPSCLMAPARRPCPTASVSPPSSARIHPPPSTTPPGCSSSKSGSGPASPPSSRPLKSSPQSVPLILFLLMSIQQKMKYMCFLILHTHVGPVTCR